MHNCKHIFGTAYVASHTITSVKVNYIEIIHIQSHNILICNIQLIKGSIKTFDYYNKPVRLCAQFMHNSQHIFGTEHVASHTNSSIKFNIEIIHNQLTKLPFIHTMHQNHHKPVIFKVVNTISN